MRRSGLLLLCFFLGRLSGMTFGDITLHDKTYFRVETPSLILHFNRLGGRLDRIFYKTGEQEFADVNGRGVLTENEWNKESLSRDFLYKRPFSLRHERLGDCLVVTCHGHHVGGGIDFLEVTKRYTIRENSPLIRVDYTFHNQREAMSPVVYALHIHTGLKLPGIGSVRYQIPSEEGIKDGDGGWENAPSRGWIGAVSPSGTGFAVSMSFPELHNVLVWGKSTVEWRYLPRLIGHGESWKTFVEIIPFTGLPRVSGAGHGVVGSLIHAPRAAVGEVIPVTIRLHNNRQDKNVDIELRARQSAAGRWRTLRTGSLRFGKPDESRSFQATLGCEQAGSLELEAIVRQGERELTRLNSRILVGTGEASWKLDLLEPRAKGILKKTDLTRFTHRQPDPAAIPWATPLPGGKIRVLALCPYIYQFGDLAQRLDLDYSMSWVYQNSWKLSGGDYMLCEDECTHKTVFENIRRSLARDYDVIFIGGISWGNFPQDIQESILGKVSGGTGLVITGLDEGNGFLNVTGRRRHLSEACPRTVKRSFLTSGVPFDFFPRGKVYRLTGGDDVQVKADQFTYLTTSRHGLGKVVAYGYAPNLYHTGLMPHDPTEPYYVYDHPTPYELYFSMLAKGIFHAAGREPALDFESFSAASGRQVWQLQSRESGEVRWDYLVTDRNNDIRLRGSRGVSLARGHNTVSLGLSLPTYAGKQIMSVIVRDGRGRVLNWGSWSFTQEPPARIVGVTTDRKAYDDGDTISYEVRADGQLPGHVLRVELVDSYGRRLASHASDASALVRGTFQLRNRLPARYARIRAYLLSGETEVDTGGCHVLTRPSEKLMAWDDYHVNSIVYWSGQDSGYRMKRTGEIYRSLELDMLMNCWGKDYVLLNNFLPHVGVGSLIGSQNYPSAAYLKTGDKRLLTRKRCLSDEQAAAAFYAKVDSRVAAGRQYGAMFYDIGDEIALSRSGSPVDFCFSEHCLGGFRKYLEKKYVSLQVLNREWETSFGSWEEVLPFTKEEVWASHGRHVASWSDHREFMDEACLRHLREIKRRIRQQDPQGKLSVSGTLVPNAYGGLDWAKLMQVYDSMQNYSERMQNEIHRSFARPGYTSFPWHIGYKKTGQLQVYWTWYSSFMGASGISLWCLHSGLLFPDLVPQRGMVDALPGLRRLHNGIGKLLMDVYAPRRSEVAILYSQSSLRGAFIEKRMDSQLSLWEKYILLCRNLGVDFSFISYEQLERGILEREGYKLLILPDACAMSDKEIAAVESFFRRGGHVLAEGMPGRLQSNCVQRSTEPLLGIFTASQGRTLLLEEPDTDYVLLQAAPNSQLNRAQILFEQQRFAAQLTKAGISYGPFVLTEENGDPLVEAKQYLKRGNGSWFAGLMTDVQKLKRICVTLPERAYVYDVVSGKYWGQVKRFDVEFQQGKPLGLLLLPEPIGWKTVDREGSCIRMRLTHDVESIANLKVYAPDGRRVHEYGKNVNLHKGRGTYEIPWAESDVSGLWRVVVTEVISGDRVTLKIKR